MSMLLIVGCYFQKYLGSDFKLGRNIYYITLKIELPRTVKKSFTDAVAEAISSSMTQSVTRDHDDSDSKHKASHTDAELNGKYHNNDSTINVDGSIKHHSERQHDIQDHNSDHYDRVNNFTIIYLESNHIHIILFYSRTHNLIVLKRIMLTQLVMIILKLMKPQIKTPTRKLTRVKSKLTKV